jgi:hypothetical protein
MTVSPAGNILSIRERLEERAATRDALADREDVVLDPSYSNAVYSVALALACYIQLDGPQFISIVDLAREAASVNDGGEAVLASLRAHLGAYDS